MVVVAAMMLLAAATALHMPRGRIATGSLIVADRSSPLLRSSPLCMSSQPSAAEGPAAAAISRYYILPR